jgi:hypothetical protein
METCPHATASLGSSMLMPNSFLLAVEHQHCQPAKETQLGLFSFSLLC